MGWRRFPLVVVVALALLPGAVVAQEGAQEEGFLLRINGPARLATDERAATVVVINGDARVSGQIVDTLIVIRGDAVVDGAVDGDVVVINGTLDLRDTARVGGDVTLIRSEMTRAPGATVTGTIEEREDVWVAWRGPGALFSFLLWLAFTIVVLVAGLLFAAIGGGQLSGAGTLLTDRVGPTLLATVVLWLAVPVGAVLLFFTLIGIPLGIAVLVFLLPALWFLGYLVAGTRVGGWVLQRAGRPAGREHPYLAALVGLLILQLLLWVPVLGGLVFVLAGLVGAGALAYLAWRAAAGRGTPVPERTRTA